MKCISIKQPWAWLITSGVKDVENRTWKTDYRGDILIHAGQSFDFDCIEWLMDNGLKEIAVAIAGRFGIKIINNKPVVTNKDIIGGIVGCCGIDNITMNDNSIWAQPECYHWKVSSAKELPLKPCAGKLSIYEEQY